MDFFSRLTILIPRENEIEKKKIIYEKTAVPLPSPGTTETKTEPEKEEEPFSITEMSRIDDPELSSEGIHFISTLSYGNKGIITTKKKVFYQEAGAVKEVNTGIQDPLFRMKPMETKNYFLLISSQNICVVHKENLSIEEVISFSSREALLYHYHPDSAGSLLYIPVINTGYYTWDLTSDKPQLSEFYKEKFPISPVITGDGIVVGSYNNNYIAMLDKEGNNRWNFPLPGESWTNVIIAGNRLYTHVTREGTYYIISIDMEGKKTGEWQVGGKCIADPWVFGHTLFGIYTNGTLFSLDTGNGKIKEIPGIMTINLSSELWRSINPFIDGDRFYMGTSSGELLCYNMAREEEEYRIMIAENESFYAPPYIIDKGIYLVSNRGKVFEVIKNED
jgi:hypothetical protein